MKKLNKTIRSKRSLVYKGRGKTRTKCKTNSKRRCKNLNRTSRKRRKHVGSGILGDLKNKIGFGSAKVQPIETKVQDDVQTNRFVPYKIKEGWERVIEDQKTTYQNILGIVESCYFSLSLDNGSDKQTIIKNCIDDAKDVAETGGNVLIPSYMWEMLSNDLNNANLSASADSGRIITSNSEIKNGKFYKYISNKLHPPPIDKTKTLNPNKY